MADQLIVKRLKDKVMSTCVTPACLYGTETLALTDLQQQRLQLCENNWVRKISKSNEGRYAKNGGVKGRDGSAEELDRETGGSRLRWAGHVERMADARPANRAADLREQGETRGSRLRWEDCTKRDVKKGGEEGDWKKKTGEREEWKRLADEAVKKLQAAPHP